jgi:16S rRNA (guanine527-N7)-methyltransferase
MTPVSRETADLRTLLISHAQQFTLALDDIQADRLLEFFHLVLRWNQRLNLIGPGPMDAQLAAHLIDALAVVPRLGSGPANWLDIGSGAGFPAIPIKLVRPDLRMSLHEPRAKRAAFLRHARRHLQLVDLDVHTARLSPDPPSDQSRAFDYVSARALTELPRLIELASPRLKPGGRLVAYKGRSALEESETAAGRMAELGLVLDESFFYDLPVIERRRCILILRQTGAGF